MTRRLDDARLVERFLDRLAGGRSGALDRHLIRRWAASGRVELLLRLVEALLPLVSVTPVSPVDEAPRSGRRRIQEVYDPVIQGRRMTLGLIGESLSSTLGLVQARAALEYARLAGDAVASGMGQLPYCPAAEVCGRLASAQPLETLTSLFDESTRDNRYVEPLACLLQEMVMRGLPCSDTPILRGFADRLIADAHPLAWLPLRTVEIENGERMMRYHADGFAAMLPSLSRRHLPEPLHCAEDGPTPDSEEASSHEETALIAAACAGWAAGSYARTEARVFRLSHEAVLGDLSPRFVESLGLVSAEMRGVQLVRISASDAWGILFSAANAGCRGGRERHGAYGRLDAWRSLAGLSGAGASASFDGVYEAVGGCEWLFYNAELVVDGSSWFYPVGCWDFGIVALRPDRRSLAVLAATAGD